MIIDMDGFSVLQRWDQSRVLDLAMLVYHDDIAIVTHG